MRRTLLLIAILGCGDSPQPPPAPTKEEDLLATLEALAAMGEKAAGTPAGQQAAAYIQERFEAMKLSDVRLESFSFPQWKLVRKTLSISIDGVPMSPGFDVFEASGSGTFTNAEIVNAETATDGELEGRDLTGQVALVIRDPSFHRSAQYRNVQRANASAMLYLSIAPDNLRQVGSVRFDWEAAGTIPAITVGADDGAIIRDAVIAGADVRASIDVEVVSAPALGTNVVGIIPGERPETIVLGAHFDTWFAGSADNGGGVAELLAVAERRMKRPKPKYTLMFVAFDGEEIGLYGGYDLLRRHVVVGQAPIAAVLNFESPSATEPEIAGLVRSNQPALDDALKAAHLRSLYGVYAGLEVVAELFGGIIPTDIQGVYRSGVPTVTTAVTNAYYHTTADTPDKVDLELLALSTDAFDDALDLIMANDPSVYEVVDPELWTATVTTAPGATFDVTVSPLDGAGNPGIGAKVSASILYDDFFLAGTLEAVTDATGKVTFSFPNDSLALGSGKRYLHIGAGPEYPLVEQVIALP
jgi:Zn-dependent M28 family amino/carboxypeptidase